MKFFFTCLLAVFCFVSAAKAGNLVCPNFNGSWECPDPEPNEPGAKLIYKVKQTKSKVRITGPNRNEETLEYSLKPGKQKMVYNGEAQDEYLYTVACTENSIVLNEEISIEDNYTAKIRKTHTLSEDKSSFELKVESLNEVSDGDEADEPITIVCNKKR